MQPEISELITQVIRFYKKYKMQLNIIGTSILTLIFVQGLANALIMDTLLFSYISYKTLLVIKINSDDNTKLVHMLKLWGSYSTYLFAEKIMDILMYFTPLSFVYYVCKIGFYLWIFKSEGNADIYYDVIVTPFFNKYEHQITILMHGLEKFIKILISIISEYIEKLKGLLIKFITEKLNEDTFQRIEDKLNKFQLENFNLDDLQRGINEMNLETNTKNIDNYNQTTNENCNHYYDIDFNEINNKFSENDSDDKENYKNSSDDNNNINFLVDPNDDIIRDSSSDINNKFHNDTDSSDNNNTCNEKLE